MSAENIYVGELIEQMPDEDFRCEVLRVVSNSNPALLLFPADKEKEQLIKQAFEEGQRLKAPVLTGMGIVGFLSVAEDTQKAIELFA